MSYGRQIGMKTWCGGRSLSMSVTKSSDHPDGELHQLRLQIQSKATAASATQEIDILLTAEEADFLKRALDQ